MRLARVELESELTPVEALRTLRGDDRPFALAGSWAGGGALLGSQPVRVASGEEDPFALLEDLPAVEGHEGVGGGWFGYLGYSLGQVVPPPPRPVALPPFALAYYDHVLRLDPDGRWWFESLGEPDEGRLELLRARLRGPAPPPQPFELGTFHARPKRTGHAAAVDWCRRWIAAGDLYQANLCLRLEAAFRGSALDLFASGTEALDPEHAAFLSGPWGAVASMSPELFLRRRGRAVVSAPIKGTSTDRDALVASAKDRAENVMIVDLMRNDLGKSCAYGSVEVSQLAHAVRGPGVWHLVSEVRGTVADGVGDGRLVRGCFPPGSVTGAPKLKSMEVISQLESSAREVYTGAIGFASPVAGLELSVAIRTFEVARGRAWLGAGGGITWGSDPAAEWRECLTKARPLLAAVGAELEADAEPAGRVAAPSVPAAPGAFAAPAEFAAVAPPGGPVPAPPAAPAPPRGPAAPTRHRRPDPARGVFETILAVDGKPVLLDEHLARLRASVAELYDAELQSIAIPTPPPGAWRIRVVFRPGAGISVGREPASFPVEPLEPRLLVLPGGLGAHKWVDRALVAGVEPLIVDLCGEVLESGSGNVFIVEGDALVTPPADGRILPGVTRAEVIRTVEVSVEPIDLERLRAADEVFVTSAIRGRQPVAATTCVSARRV